MTKQDASAVNYVLNGIRKDLKDGMHHARGGKTLNNGDHLTETVILQLEIGSAIKKLTDFMAFLKTSEAE
jgi:hypothetical protein